MKKSILLGLISIPLSALGDLQTQKLECFSMAPSCSTAAFFSSASSEDISFNGILVGGHVNVAVTLQRTNQASSVMSITLTDAGSRRSESKSFIINDDAGVYGAVEGFRAADGKKYTVACSGRHLSAGTDSITSPGCP